MCNDFNYPAEVCLGDAVQVNIGAQTGDINLGSFQPAGVTATTNAAGFVVVNIPAGTFTTAGVQTVTFTCGSGVGQNIYDLTVPYVVCQQPANCVDQQLGDICLNTPIDPPIQLAGTGTFTYVAFGSTGLNLNADGTLDGTPTDTPGPAFFDFAIDGGTPCRASYTLVECQTTSCENQTFPDQCAGESWDLTIPGAVTYVSGDGDLDNAPVWHGDNTEAAGGSKTVVWADADGNQCTATFNVIECDDPPTDCSVTVTFGDDCDPDPQQAVCGPVSYVARCAGTRWNIPLLAGQNYQYVSGDGEIQFNEWTGDDTEQAGGTKTVVYEACPLGVPFGSEGCVTCTATFNVIDCSSNCVLKGC